MAGLWTEALQHPYLRGKPDNPMSDKITIAVADDHSVFRCGVTTLLSLEDDMEIIASLSDGSQVLDLLENAEPQILLLDLRMPGMNGLETLRRLKGKERNLRIILLTASEDQAEYAEAVANGASGVMLKQAATDSLADCIRTVAAGEIWLDSEALPLPDDFSSAVITG